MSCTVTKRRFTADEYQQLVMDEYNLVFRYHRSIFHYHLLKVGVVPVALHSFHLAKPLAPEQKAQERAW